MRALAVLVPVLGLAAALVAAPSCGKSELAKAYESYTAKVEPLLDREAAVWKKLRDLVNEQGQDESPDLTRFADVLQRESVPFYDEFRTDVGKLEPGDPALAPAQEALAKFAKARADFVHEFADNLDALRVDGPSGKLAVTDRALTGAMGEYSKTLQGDLASGDTRFADLISLQTDFQTNVIEPLSEGRRTAEDGKERIETRILPKIRDIRATKFADDDSARLLRNAVAASEEFFLAVVPNLPRMEAGARLKRSSTALEKDANDALVKFRDEMKSVRGRK